MRQLPVTGIVASRNEAGMLGRCLDALAFCDELIVIDLESTDATKEVAEQHGARVLPHPLVTVVEEARLPAIAEARHDWLLVRDPDEIVPAPLAAQIDERFDGFGADVGLVLAPTRRFFRGRPLQGTPWGGVQVDRLLARRGLVEFPTTVHARLVRKPGCTVVEIPFTGDNAIEHYWAGGYRALIEKHVRYLRREGVARAAAGETTGWANIAATGPRELWHAYVGTRGYRDGVRGLALSVIWAAYRTGAQVALLKELRRQ